jgi:hypothetical protein
MTALEFVRFFASIRLNRQVILDAELMSDFVFELSGQARLSRLSSGSSPSMKHNFLRSLIGTSYKHRCKHVCESVLWSALLLRALCIRAQET